VSLIEALGTETIRSSRNLPVERQIVCPEANMFSHTEHANALSSFFEEPETSFGVFYPRHYILATFQSFEVTKQACFALRKAGFNDHEALALSGGEALDFFEDFRDRAGIWGNLMREFSRFIDTEATLVDKDIRRAQKGAGFLVVHSPTEHEASCVRETLAPFAPIAMHWYLPSGIQSLV